MGAYRQAVQRPSGLQVAGNFRKVTILPGMTVVAVGDSITANGGGYFAPFRTALDAVFVAAKKTALTWVNSGVSGNGVTDANGSSLNLNTKIATLITPFNADAIFILVGVNDAVGGANQATYQAGLTSFIGSCISPRCPARQIAVCSVWLDPAIDALMDQYVTGGRTVAASFGCPFVDVRTGSPSAGSATLDSIHPNDSVGKPYLSSKLTEICTGVVL